ncbi:MAG TPA: GNAT family N-acetyltransferase [Anaerolineales bacterium]
MNGWTIRQATADDRLLVDGLILGSRWKHLHLDWLDPAALADRAPFLLATQAGLPVGCLGCPPDLPGVSWLRAFAVTSGIQPELAWQPLWELAASGLRELQVDRVAALPIEGWFELLLTDSGYQPTNAVIFFERELVHSIPAPSHPSRPIEAADEAALLELDHLAFEPFWQLSSDSLRAALSQADTATLIELAGKMVGYQITTRSPFGAHLARLAVHPDRRRQGLGRSLVSEALQRAQAVGLGRLSVNTQADNLPSQRLYRSLGFRETGQRYRVLETRLAQL